MNAPADAFRCQALAKEIAAELRAKVRSEYETVLNMKTAKALGLEDWIADGGNGSSTSLSRCLAHVRFATDSDR